jgi:predicted secreted Zn-dependent protease
MKINGIDVDLDGVTWRKSSFSDMSGGNCVEVAFVGDMIAVRDSKDPAGPVLGYTRAEWDAFIGGVRDGEFDH